MNEPMSPYWYSTPLPHLKAAALSGRFIGAAWAWLAWVVASIGYDALWSKQATTVALMAGVSVVPGLLLFAMAVLLAWEERDVARATLPSQSPSQELVSDVNTIGGYQGAVVASLVAGVFLAGGPVAFMAVVPAVLCVAVLVMWGARMGFASAGTLMAAPLRGGR